MAVSADYPQPVQVNGFSCRNCSDVDLAKKHVDPRHPASGPYGVDATTDPTQSAAVRFGGALSDRLLGAPSAAVRATGAVVDLTA